MLDRNIRVPVITIGGFLGAGKTTLVNQLLRKANDTRLVVFVNDFGAINIDYNLIEAAEANRISLKNGCVCCTLNDDLITTLKSFLAEDNPPDGFIIEASGIADPRALDQSIILLEQAGEVRFDNRIYVVDVDQFSQHEFEDVEMIIDHAAAADLVLLNKRDLASSQDCIHVENLFVKSAPNSMLLAVNHCNCPIELVLSKGLSGRQSFSSDINFNTPLNHHGFTSWMGKTERMLDLSKFENFTKELSSTCFRAKGVLYFEQYQSNPSIFHMVGNRATLERSRAHHHGQFSQIVAIGKAKSIDPFELEKRFEDLLT